MLLLLLLQRPLRLLLVHERVLWVLLQVPLELLLLVLPRLGLLLLLLKWLLLRRLWLVEWLPQQVQLLRLGLLRPVQP